MICNTCRLSIGHIQTVDDYEDICAVADDPIARLDGSIGTEGCAWYLPEVRGMKNIGLSAKCPFCGCGQMYTVCNVLHDKSWVVECCKCHAQGPHADTEKEALNLWNERVKE